MRNLRELGLDLSLFMRTPNGNISAPSLRQAAFRLVGLPDEVGHQVDASLDMRWQDASKAMGLPRFSLREFSSVHKYWREKLAELCGYSAHDLFPNDFRPDGRGQPIRGRAAALLKLSGTARGFRMAIDALPVGRDVRTRLLAHVDAHIAAIEALDA